MSGLDFMIIGLPRSGTTWLANYFNTESIFCMHDPLNLYHYSSLDAVKENMPEKDFIGVSCSALWRWKDWVNNHPAKKVTIFRDPGEVSRSLVESDLHVDLEGWENILEIDSLQIRFDDLFDIETMSTISGHLFDREIDRTRYYQLREMLINPYFEKVRINGKVQHKLALELDRLKTGN